jgi:hypothetical protein
MLGISYVVLTAIAVSHGIGRHSATLRPEDISYAVKYLYISFAPGMLSFAVPKFAVVILLIKILYPGRWHQAVIWVVSILYLLMVVAMLAVDFVLCIPATAQWGEADWKCWDRGSIMDYAIALAIFSVLFDVYLAVYPTIVLCRILLNWKKKLALSSALGFGYW